MQLEMAQSHQFSFYRVRIFFDQMQNGIDDQEKRVDHVINIGLSYFSH